MSVADVEITLDEAGIRAFLVGREVYRRTGFLFSATGTPPRALVQVAKDSLEPLFSPATDVRVLAEPDRLLWVQFRGGNGLGNAARWPSRPWRPSSRGSMPMWCRASSNT